MTQVRIQLSDSALRQLKSRAALGGFSLGDYTHRIFHYLTTDKGLIGSQESRPQFDSDSVYIAIDITLAIREKLSELSRRQSRNLAAFSGGLVTSFLSKFDRDPRDLSMIYEISLALEQKSLLTADDLVYALRQAHTTTESRDLLAKHVVNWLFGRVRPLMRTIDREGRPVDLTIQLIEELLASR